METTTQPDYASVELTPEEEHAALLEARKQKYAKAEQERFNKEYWQKLTNAPVAKRYTAEELRNKLLLSRNALGKRFVIDDDNIAQVNTLCMYFADDPRQEQYGINREKGLLLMGAKGVGKTHLMSFFFQNQKASYAIASCRNIENKWQNSKKEDPDMIEYYSGNVTGALNTNPYGHVELGVFFDDLGTETVPSKRYGEVKNIMWEILLARYERRLPFYRTHIATNLTDDQIFERYDSRVHDRLIEMCNVITFTSTKSRRA